MTDLLTQMKAEHARAFAQRSAELRKQGADEISTTMDRLQMNPEPAPGRRFVGDPGIAGDQNWRYVGEDDEDDEDAERSEHRHEHDVGASPGESEGGTLAKVQKAQETGLIGSDAECQSIEKRLAAIDATIAKVSRYETGSPVTKSAVRGTRATLRQEKRELLSRYQVLKSEGTRRAIANHRPADGVMHTGPLPAPRPFGLHG